MSVVAPRPSSRTRGARGEGRGATTDISSYLLPHILFEVKGLMARMNRVQTLFATLNYLGEVENSYLSFTSNDKILFTITTLPKKSALENTR